MLFEGVIVIDFLHYLVVVVDDVLSYLLVSEHLIRRHLILLLFSQFPHTILNILPYHLIIEIPDIIFILNSS